MVQLTDAQKLERIREAYERLPKLKNCKGFCFRACQTVPMTNVERDNIQKKHNLKLVEPVNTSGAVAAGTLSACKALTKDRKCGVYEDRPLICRAWGAVETLPCRFGCKPEGRLMGAVDFAKLNAEISILGGRPNESKSSLIKALQLLDTDQGIASYLMFAGLALRQDQAWWAKYIKNNPDDLPLGSLTNEGQTMLTVSDGGEVTTINNDRILIVNDFSTGNTVVLDEATDEQITLQSLYFRGFNMGKGREDMFVISFPPGSLDDLLQAVLNMMEQQGEEDAANGTENNPVVGGPDTGDGGN